MQGKNYVYIRVRCLTLCHIIINIVNLAENWLLLWTLNSELHKMWIINTRYELLVQIIVFHISNLYLTNDIDDTLMNEHFPQLYDAIVTKRNDESKGKLVSIVSALSLIVEPEMK